MLLTRLGLLAGRAGHKQSWSTRSWPQLAVRQWVRHSTGLWRKVPIYQRAGRWRVHPRLDKPTQPVRIEGVRGQHKDAFRHGILLPDGYVIPWMGKPHNEFVEFWKRVVVKWGQIIAERRASDQDEWFCCPRCDGFLERHARPTDFDPELDAQRWFCPTEACGIEEATIRKHKSIAHVQVAYRVEPRE